MRILVVALLASISKIISSVNESYSWKDNIILKSAVQFLHFLTHESN